MFTSRYCACRVKTERVLCTVVPQVNATQRWGIGRTGTKHKRARSERAAEDSHKQGPRLVALEAAVAAAATAVRVAQGDDAAVREWLDGHRCHILRIA